MYGAAVSNQPNSVLSAYAPSGAALVAVTSLIGRSQWLGLVANDEFDRKEWHATWRQRRDDEYTCYRGAVVGQNAIFGRFCYQKTLCASSNGSLVSFIIIKTRVSKECLWQCTPANEPMHSTTFVPVDVDLCTRVCFKLLAPTAATSNFENSVNSHDKPPKLHDYLPHNRSKWYEHGLR